MSDGGIVPMLGVTPSYFGNSLQNINDNSVSQVWQGSGQSFASQPGQSLAGTANNSVVNIAVSPYTAKGVPQLNDAAGAGFNYTAAQVTPFITSDISGGLNDDIAKTLGSAGNFSSALSNITPDTVTAGFNIGNLAGGGGASGVNPGGYSSKTFPGAGQNESPADYAGGKAYTLGSNGKDVVFSIQPANQGPQLFGQNQAQNDPKVATTMATNQYTSKVPSFSKANVDSLNFSKMADIGLPSIGSATDYASFWKPEAATDFATSAGAGFGAAEPGKSSEGWTFICAPENISYDVANAVDRVPMFGTNSPPVISGTAGMQDLQLGNALVEGFVRNVTVEAKLAALEKLMDFKLNTSQGFVNVPVYQVWANSKAYGQSGYFVIKDIKVKETMRDLKGDATRAMVDISFMQVPQYQVSSGRDQASKKTTAAKSSLDTKNQVDSNLAKGVAGPNAPSPLAIGGAGSGASSNTNFNYSPPETQYNPNDKLNNWSPTPPGPALRPEPLW